MSIVVFDGTSHFVESRDYKLQKGEQIVFSGPFQNCCIKADELNDRL